MVGRKWEDESKEVKGKLKKDGIYTVPFDEEAKKLIDELFPERGGVSWGSIQRNT
jgi:hypothetical protein